MKNTPHDTGTKSPHEHGSTGSYVVGFLLSLVFTIIPYYLVTEKVVTGSTLLAIILGFAVLQMVVQVVFFLHLGRGPKPSWNLYFFIGTVGTILFVVVASLWIMHHLHYNMTPVTSNDASKKLIGEEGIYQIGGRKTGACQELHENHQVIIKDGHASPLYTAAQVCDTLTFVNQDDIARQITFGTATNPSVYAGEAEVTVRAGKNKTITLSEAGVYQFHDKLQEEVTGSFTVTLQ